jgi:hypothetical protein
MSYPSYEHLNPHFISDTATHTGRFWKIVFKASCEIQGIFTSIKLNGGAVVAYRV